MVLPNLIHPVNVTVERLVRDNLLMDEDAREPIHGVRTSTAQTFTFPAQIKWSERDSPDPEAGGIREGDVGYILVRLVDLDTYLGSGVRLARGDRIISMGVLSGLDLYILGNVPMGHYPDQSGMSLLKYNFTDRHPSRQVGDL